MRHVAERADVVALLRGSTLLGSPPTIFEYMSVGRCIVASALEQLREGLEPNCTAWLVRLGEVELAAALRSTQKICSALDMIVPVAAHTQA